MNKQIDIYKALYSKIHKIPYEKVTEENRCNVKWMWPLFYTENSEKIIKNLLNVE